MCQSALGAVCELGIVPALQKKQAYRKVTWLAQGLVIGPKLESLCRQLTLDVRCFQKLASDMNVILNRWHFNSLTVCYCMGLKYIHIVLQLTSPNYLIFSQRKLSGSYTNFLLETPGKHHLVFWYKLDYTVK